MVKNDFGLRILRIFYRLQRSDETLYAPHWFVRHSKSMDTFRADVKKELGGSPPQSVWPDVLTDGFYRVRRSWNETATQKGAFRVLAYAKNCADANKGYSVYSNNGTLIYKGKQI